jgi:hypothetical protein
MMGDWPENNFRFCFVFRSPGIHAVTHMFFGIEGQDEGRLRPFSAAGGLRPGIYAGLARRKRRDFGLTPVHGRSRCPGFSPPQRLKPVEKAHKRAFTEEKQSGLHHDPA